MVLVDAKFVEAAAALVAQQVVRVAVEHREERACVVAVVIVPLGQRVAEAVEAERVEAVVVEAELVETVAEHARVAPVAEAAAVAAAA